MVLRDADTGILSRLRVGSETSVCSSVSYLTSKDYLVYADGNIARILDGSAAVYGLPDQYLG